MSRNDMSLNVKIKMEVLKYEDSTEYEEAMNSYG